MNTTPLLHAISLSEAYINVILILLSIILKNTYLFAIFICMFTKHVPEQIGKRISHYYGLELGKRPYGAMNCNSLNAGGIAHGSGLISGHVFNISSLTFFLLYTFTENGRQITSNEIKLLSVLFMLIFALMYARVQLNCHTKEQVIIGFSLGIAWGYIMTLQMKLIISLFPKVGDDKVKMGKVLNGC